MRKFLADYHTHTTYCDGHNTPREMAERACALGFDALGFSGHGYTPFDDSYCMTESGTKQYLAEIAELKKEYEGKIKIFAGAEVDINAKMPDGEFDYIIGSSHYININGRYFPIDKSTEDFSAILNECFGGDFEAMAEHYFSGLASLFEGFDADIIGHFDLVTKYIERLPLQKGERYYRAAFSAVDRLLPAGKPFEINVGAISRGYRTCPYPDEKILSRIKSGGGEIILSGDCHSAENLGKFFDTGIAVAKKCGFTHRLVLTEDGFKSIEL